MSSIVEQATRRLEELRQSGVVIPWGAGPAPDGAAQPVPNVAPAVARVEPADLASSVPGVRPVATDGLPPAEAKAREAGVSHRQSAVVTIDLAKLSGEGLLNPNLDRIDMVEELRAIKWPLLAHARESDRGPQARDNLILVTSALPGEGKTHCAINLAMSIAMEVDHSVLLVDADVVRPSVMTRLGVEARHGKGLLDVLTRNDMDLSDVMLRTNVPKLTLLPAGTSTDKSTELLASTTMDRLLNELATRYPDRIVIFDAPPLLATSESRVLANHVGQVVLVIEAGKTPQRAVSQALAALEPCETVWTLLNKVNSRNTVSAYGRYTAARGSD